MKASPLICASLGAVLFIGLMPGQAEARYRDRGSRSRFDISIGLGYSNYSRYDRPYYRSSYGRHYRDYDYCGPRYYSRHSHYYERPRYYAPVRSYHYYYSEPVYVRPYRSRHYYRSYYCD